MQSIIDNLVRIETGITNIKQALIGKGAEIGENDKIDSLAEKINNLPTGGGGTVTIPKFTVNDPLTFVCVSDTGDEKIGIFRYTQESEVIPDKVIEYNINGGDWQNYTEEEYISLNFGDYI